MNFASGRTECSKHPRDDEEKDVNVVKKKQKMEIEEPEKVDLIALMDGGQSNQIQMKAPPAPNKKGKINYYGYMDKYFGGTPPIPLSNIIYSNEDYTEVKIITGSM